MSRSSGRVLRAVDQVQFYIDIQNVYNINSYIGETTVRRVPDNPTRTLVTFSSFLLPPLAVSIAQATVKLPLSRRYNLERIVNRLTASRRSVIAKEGDNAAHLRLPGGLADVGIVRLPVLSRGRR